MAKNRGKFQKNRFLEKCPFFKLAQILGRERSKKMDMKVFLLDKNGMEKSKSKDFLKKKF